MHVFMIFIAIRFMQVRVHEKKMKNIMMVGLKSVFNLPILWYDIGSASERRSLGEGYLCKP